MPKERKKKNYIITVEVDMCAEHTIKVKVTATNPILAMHEAIEKCKQTGLYFHVKALNWKLADEE